MSSDFAKGQYISGLFQLVLLLSMALFWFNMVLNNVVVLVVRGLQ